MVDFPKEQSEDLQTSSREACCYISPLLPADPREHISNEPAVSYTYIIYVFLFIY